MGNGTLRDLLHHSSNRQHECLLHHHQWMVLAARDLADELDRQNSACTSDDAGKSRSSDVAALDAFGYDEAAEHVYGMRYDQWKKRFQREATAEEMQRYTASQSIHAQHDKSRLEQNIRPRPGPATTTTITPSASNVCCEPAPLPKVRATSSGVVKAPPYTYPGSFKFGVLTISDRAARGAYETGDLSGPAVVETLQSLLLTSSSANSNSITSIQVAIVADEKPDIQSQLLQWCDHDDGVDIIFTTGGTGLARRDVTPEATIEILDAEWRAVMALSSRTHVLSRGTAGFRKNTVIANLPGNPQAAREILPELLPILWKATLELRQDGCGK
jgi:molybdopterin adenylyltransferase